MGFVQWIIRRYELARVSPPVLLYTDRDCCGERKVSSLFTAWKELVIRLDLWHFMHRFVSGCTTDSHPLCGTFIARLSQCIFEWSSEDLSLLKKAKTDEVLNSKIRNSSDEGMLQRKSCPLTFVGKLVVFKSPIFLKHFLGPRELTPLVYLCWIPTVSGPSGSRSKNTFPACKTRKTCHCTLRLAP